jgi:hypothetical protein
MFSIVKILFFSDMKTAEFIGKNRFNKQLHINSTVISRSSAISERDCVIRKSYRFDNRAVARPNDSSASHSYIQNKHIKIV